MAKKVLKDIKDIKFITIGEVLLRLSPPNFGKRLPVLSPP